MYFSHSAHTFSSIYACVYLYIEIYNTYVHFDTRKDMFYFIISKYFTRFLHRFLFRLSHLLGAHESDGNLTECLTSRPINFITLISLFYKNLHIYYRSYWYTYTCIHVRMYACMCMYVRICMYACACIWILWHRETKFSFYTSLSIISSFSFYSAHLIILLNEVLYTYYIDYISSLFYRIENLRSKMTRTHTCMC